MSGCEHEGGVDRQSEEMGTALLRACFRHLGADAAVDPHEGGKFIALAFRGFGVREHFDAHHPDQIERGEEMGKLFADAEREAWLFGYRFVDRKGGV